MLEFYNNRLRYHYTLCQQCGICESACPKLAISYELQRNGTHNIFIDENKCIKCKCCINVCPANKESIFDGYFDKFSEKVYFLGYNKDHNIRRLSSSGGVCKTLIIEGLKNGYVDGVYSLRKIDKYPYAEGEFYTKNNIPKYDDIPNSVYHSVMACTNVRKIEKCERLMVIGTSCQLRALDKIVRSKCHELIKVCIFCKQQKTLDSTRFLAKIIGTGISEDLKFSARYRGEGWPGIVKINGVELPWNRAAQLPFGRRLWTVPGCDICGDSYGVEVGADISLMDPWIIRKANELGETLVVVHTAKGMDLLKNIPNLMLEEKNYQQVEPALSLKDIWRKQQLVPFFRGVSHDKRIIRAGMAEIWQRKLLSSIVERLPRMPILFYRCLCKLPDLRNKILR